MPRPAHAAAALLALASASAPASAEGGPPPDRFGRIALAYADAMLAHGRDTYGEGEVPSGDSKRSGLFLSAMDRRTLTPLGHVPPVPEGARAGDRVYDRTAPEAERRLVGCNPGHDQQLYALLYGLSEATGEPRYAAAADAALGWFFANARSGPDASVEVPTGLVAWGEHLSWDPFRDRAISSIWSFRTHEFYGPWRLWHRVPPGAPGAAAGVDAFARGLWEQQVLDHETGLFSRHGSYDGEDPRDPKPLDFPRHAGYLIDAWSAAVADPAVRGSDAALLHAIDVLLARYEKKRANVLAAGGPEPGLVPFTSSTRPRAEIPESTFANVASSLELAIEAHHAAGRLEGTADPELVRRLRAFGQTEDEVQLGLDHRPRGDGLVKGLDSRDGRVLVRTAGLWGQAYGGGVMAQDARLFIDRAAQAEGPAADRYRELVVGVAEAYLAAPIEPVWPQEAADAIEVLLFAHGLEPGRGFLGHAVAVADAAAGLFFDGGPLPSATPDADHYETITGGDDLALALFHLDRRLAAGDGPPPSPAAAGSGG